MENSEIPFEDPHLALRIRISVCKSINTHSIWEKVWGSAEFFAQICCDEAAGPDEFYTKAFARKKVVAVNEQFAFVLPQKFAQQNEDTSDPVKIKVALYKNGQKFDQDDVDVSYFKLHKKYQMTLHFQQAQDVMKLEIEIEKTPMSRPDFRYSFQPCQNETEAVTRRRELVFQSMQSFLVDEGKPRSLEEVPTISVACSGGGYRSVMQFSGAMEAMMEAGLFGCVTYMSGLSGGAWYVLSAYAKEVFGNLGDLKNFHSEIKSSTKSSLMNALVDFSHYLKYRKYAKTKETEGQPVTFVDFYGFTVGRSFLGTEKLDVKLSDLRGYAGSGEVPIPVATALHTRTKESSANFHADLEITPWEVSMPHYGLHVLSDVFGSEFYCGSMVRSCPELPLHFYMGASSTAFGMLLKYFLEGETTETDSSFIADVRSHEFGRYKTQKQKRSLKEKYAARRRKKMLKSQTSSEGENLDIVEQRQIRRSISNSKGKSGKDRKMAVNEKHLQHYLAEEKTTDPSPKLWRYSSVDYHTAEEDINENLHVTHDDSVFEIRAPLATLKESVQQEETTFKDLYSNQNAEMPSLPKQEGNLKKILKKVSNHPLFTDREAVIDRTAKVLNCARGLSNVNYTPLNPEHASPYKNETSMKISTEEDNIAFVDAAIINNVPSNCLLRPQRKTDILIVCDATEYKSDTDIDYLELFIAERLARQQGIKFPLIDPKQLKANPRGIVHVFEDKKDPKCPIVIWFTLSNREFKALENVKPPPSGWMDDTYTVPENEKFNVFPVYGSDSCYSTTNTRYTSLQFDRMKELMKHNMSSSMEVIKRQICKKVMQKRRIPE